MTALFSLMSGGLLGTVGALLTNVMGYFKDRQADKQELALKRLDLEAMDKEYEYRSREIDVAADVALNESADDLTAVSYSQDKLAYAVGLTGLTAWERAPLIFVDFIRGLIRPALTIYLIVLVHLTRASVEAVLSQKGITMSGPEALALYSTVVEMILFLTSTAVTWWFGTRTKKTTRA